MVGVIWGAVAANAVMGGLNSLSQSNEQIKSWKQQAALKNLEGDIFEKNAHTQANADAYNEDVARKQRDQELSRLRVSQAQSGISGGTMIDVQMRSQQEADLDDMMTRYNNHTKYVATMYEAEKSRTAAQQLLKNAKSLKKTRWLKALLGAGQSAMSTETASYMFK